MPRRATVYATEKSCPKCGEVKAMTTFGLRWRSPTGRKSWCRACESMRQKNRSLARSTSGICIDCGQRPNHNGTVLCLQCSTRRRIRRAARRVSGLCIGCAAAAQPGRSVCAACLAAARSRRLVTRRGVTEADYMAMLVKQGHRCAICRQECGTGRHLAVDHDHRTGRIRGLLCFRCNTSLARYEEYGPEFAAYLAGVKIDPLDPVV